MSVFQFLVASKYKQKLFFSLVKNALSVKIYAIF